MMERRLIDAALRRFLDDQAAASAGPVRSAEDARARMVRQLESRSVPGLPNGVESRDETIPRRDGTGLPIRVYTPAGLVSTRRSLPVLVHLHGGGWVAGSIETHDPFCRLLAALAGISIVAVEYRLAPEYPHPAALDDAETVLQWTAAHAAEWGADAERLTLGGDSAGGHLAAVVAMRRLLGRVTPPLRALLLLYPVTDHPSGHHGSYAENGTGYGLEAETMRWYWGLYAPDADPDDPAISPLRGPVFPELPPTLVATAQYDVLRDEGMAYARKLQDSGVAVTHLHAPDMSHNFPVGPATVARFPQSDRALAEIAAWLRRTLG
jgi:acetyl esterase